MKQEKIMLQFWTFNIHLVPIYTPGGLETLGQVVRKPVNINPGVVWDYYGSKLKGKQYKQNTSPKNYKIEIKILANPALA